MSIQFGFWCFAIGFGVGVTFMCVLLDRKIKNLSDFELRTMIEVFETARRKALMED